MHVVKSIEIASILTLFVILGGCVGNGGTVDQSTSAVVVSEQSDRKEPEKERVLVGTDRREEAVKTVEQPPITVGSSEQDDKSDEAQSTEQTATKRKDGCAEDNPKTVENILSHTKMLLSGPAEDEIQCTRMFVENSSGKKWTFRFPAKSWKVKIIGPKQQEISVDFDTLSRQAGSGLSFVIRVAYELVKKEYPEPDSSDAQFAAFVASFPASEIKRDTKIPDEVKDQVPPISSTKSYKTISGTTVYWGDAGASGKTLFLVELSSGTYTSTTIATPK